MSLEKPSITIEKIAKVGNSEVYDDVLERLYGLEDYHDEIYGISDKIYGNTIYLVETIKSILDDAEDDTNETTKCRLEAFYETVKGAEYVMVINDAGSEEK